MDYSTYKRVRAKLTPDKVDDLKFNVGFCSVNMCGYIICTNDVSYFHFTLLGDDEICRMLVNGEMDELRNG